jgi:hypothetical protein
MRFAAIVAVIINSMYNHLFQPTYILGEGGGVQDALVWQAEHDLNQERLCRSVLLSMLQGTAQTDILETRMDQVVTEVTDVVESLCVNGNADVTDLRDCVEFAYKTWDTTRKMKNLYHLSFCPYKQDDPEWVTIDLPRGGNDKVQQPVAVPGVNDDVVLEVFPRVYVAEKPIRQLSAGIALRRYQTLAARKELEEEDFRAPMIGTVRPKPAPGRARKKSVALSGHNGTKRQSVGKDQVASNH